MVDSAISITIKKLNDFITQQVNIKIGVRNGLRWLKDELSYLQISVRAAESKQEDELIRVWINDVREVANHAVTILQEEHAVPKQGVQDRLRSFICICKKEGNLYGTTDISKAIESLKGRIIDINKRREQYGITNEAQQRKRTLLKATSYENLVDVVGLEDDVWTLLDELLIDDLSLNLISIHGMGGLGKTTIASKLYHSRELSHFKSRAWVCVSQEYNTKDVLKKIIKSFVGHEPDFLNMDEDDLRLHLQNLLLNCDGYLAVIDDIWDIEAWENIKKAFPDNNNGSRVIITTRNKRVAQRIDDRCFVHQLRFLNEHESWELFCKRANPSWSMEKLGEEMVGKCRGLPLAIVVLSGLLLQKKSYDDWSRVKDDIWRQLKDGNLEIEEILTLSYDDLSFQMRKCFLYLARFPEDHTFNVDDLMRLWIAEEFICEADEGYQVIMEDVAKDYLNELLNRNMIQIAGLYSHGQVSECRVHDLVRDLVIQKATEVKLLGIFDSSKQHPSPMGLLQGQPRHAIHNNGIGEYLKLLGSSSDNLKLRSLAVPVIDEARSIVFQLEEIRLMYTRFKYLQVLDLRSVVSKGIPEEIGDLVLLKFLGLMRGDRHSEDDLVIPPSIGNLKKLRTLCSTGHCYYEFPREICELKELRHLDTVYLSGRLNISSHQTKLQTLSTITYEDWIYIDTANFTNLQTLVIQSDGESVDSLESIANLTSLRSLNLISDTLPTIKPLSYCKRLKNVNVSGIMEDPSELRLLPDSVTSLALFNTEFTQDPMPALGSLSNLTCLIGGRICMEEKMVCGQDAFPSLQLLSLRNFPLLNEWQVEDGALPSLKGFEIFGCNRVTMLPERFYGIPPIPAIYGDL